MSEYTKTEHVGFKFDTVGDSLKRVILPFLGFFDSQYTTMVNDDFETLADEGKHTNEEVDQLAESFDYTSYYSKVATSYSEFLNERMSSIFGKSVEVSFKQVEYHPMTPQNMGDEISAVINVEELPGLGYLQSFCEENDIMDFKAMLKVIAKYKFNSIGIRSLWDDNIEQFFSQEYSQWESTYIECLIAAMVLAMSVEMGNKFDIWQHTISDFELINFIDQGQTDGTFSVDV